MKKLFILCLLLSSFPHLVMGSDYITWMGCGISKKAFMDTLATVYTEKTGTLFRMAGGGASKGIRLTAAGRSDLGGTCRHRILDAEHQPIAVEQNVNMVLVGWDALVVMVYKDNPVSSLSLNQVRRIFSGEINNWSDVGGRDESILLLGREGKTSGVGYMFRLMVMQDADFTFPAGSKLFRSSGPLEEVLERRINYQAGIAVSGVSSAKKRTVKLLAIDGVKPTKANVASGQYPLFRPLYLAVSKQPNRKTQQFVEFVLSAAGQAIVSAEGTVNRQEGAYLQSQWQAGHPAP